MTELKINTDEHVFIAGKTGSGKSWVAEIYLAGMPNVIKLDTKGEYYERRRKREVLWRGLEEGRDYEVFFHLSDLENMTTNKAIYVPHEDELNQDFYESLMQWVYKRENTILWIDELMEVAPSAHKYPPALKALYTRGRSKNAVVWSCTQRPSDIPAITFANSTHYFIFALNLVSDRKKVAEGTGQPEFLTPPVGHEFLYYKQGMDQPELGILQI